jgi:hypothetical protein
LAPREYFVPYYRHTPTYVGRVNISPRTPVQVSQPVTPTYYANQAVSGGVTVVPHDVLVRRAPVANAVVAVSEPHRAQSTGAPAAPQYAAQPPAQGGRVPPPWREGGFPGQQQGGRVVSEPAPATPQQQQPAPGTRHEGGPAARHDGGPPARNEGGPPARHDGSPQVPTLTPPPSQRRDFGGAPPVGAGNQPVAPRREGGEGREGRDRAREGDRDWQPRGRNAPSVAPMPPPQQAAPVQPRAQPVMPQPTPPQGAGPAQPGPRAQQPVPAVPPARQDGDKRPRHGERDRPGETSK